MPRHIYIDCTETVRVGAHTGIQRTVRSLVASAATLPDPDLEVIPVRFDGRRFTPVEGTLSALSASADHPRRWHERARRAAVAALSTPPVRAALSRGDWLARGRDLASRSYWGLRKLRRLPPEARSVRFREGDWLVLLDATWTPDLRGELARARAAGAGVCTVVYDLIKLRRPDLVSPGAARIFERWLSRVLPLSDIVAAISQAVRDDVVDHLRASGRGALVPKVRHFPLGADFIDAAAPAQGVSPEVASALGAGRERTFLAVGSVEPRKDQATIVEAFERLWREGVDARLVLVGRPGWGSDGLARRLRTHEARGTRLIWFTDASDADLAHCYRHARGLLNVSLCEGFGLPLVEGMRYGLRVIASDIPAFREVAGDDAVYVPPGDPVSVAREVAAMLREPAGPASAPPRAVATWDESAHALIALMRDHALP